MPQVQVVIASTTSSYSRLPTWNRRSSNLDKTLFCLKSASTNVTGVNAQQQSLEALLFCVVHGKLHEFESDARTMKLGKRVNALQLDVASVCHVARKICGAGLNQLVSFIAETIT